MTKYFGTDGIRGKANEGLTAERAFQVGRYLGYYFSKDGKKKIVIGKDTRLSSDMLENALAAGIAAQGCDAYLAGYGPTPAICYLTRNEDFACGAMISASHNPFYDNGIKVFSKEGIKLPSDIEDLIERENTFTMEEFAESVNEFLAFRRYDILPDKGRISGREARLKAEAEYDEFNKTQKINSDFDKEVKKMLAEHSDK